MEKTFLIISSSQKNSHTAEQLIRSGNLGRVVCVLNSSENAVSEVSFYQPDIVLIEFSLSPHDGITITHQLISSGYVGKIILLSHSEEQEVLSRAYGAGILFLMRMPINPAEFISIVRTASELVSLQKSMNAIKNTVLSMPDAQLPQQQSVEEQLNTIFCELGLIGATGTEDIRAVLLRIIAHRHISSAPYQLKDIYRSICVSRGSSNAAAQRALEQRIRRTIQKSLSTIAQIGCADYYDSLFTEYAALLFDFRQVQQEIKHIRNSKEQCGKINTKKFMEGILSRLIL